MEHQIKQLEKYAKKQGLSLLEWIKTERLAMAHLGETGKETGQRNKGNISCP